MSVEKYNICHSVHAQVEGLTCQGNQALFVLADETDTRGVLHVVHQASGRQRELMSWLDDKSVVRL